MKENKKDIVSRLSLLLKATMAGNDIDKLLLSDDEETVHIQFNNGYIKNVNIACDSGKSIIQDVIDAL